MFALILAQGIVDSNCEGEGSCPNTLQDFAEVFLNILEILIPLGGLVLFVMLLFGGFNFIFSGGDPRKVEGARNTITYAIIGMVLLAAAFFILQIIASITGVEGILNFEIFLG